MSPNWSLNYTDSDMEWHQNGSYSNTTTGDEKINWTNIVVVTILIILDIMTIAGNLLIIVAVRTTPNLRTVTNLLILSLGVADFLVGLCVLPPAIMMHITQGVWLLGWLICDIWVSLDILLCTASILSLCAISIDRYMAISRPLTYSANRKSKKRAYRSIAWVWVLSFFITCPPILGWSEPNRHGPDEKECRYNENVGYVVYSSAGSFYLPMLVILYLSIKIVCVVRESNREFKKSFYEQNGGTPSQSEQKRFHWRKRRSQDKEEQHIKFEEEDDEEEEKEQEIDDSKTPNEVSNSGCSKPTLSFFRTLYMVDFTSMSKTSKSPASPGKQTHCISCKEDTKARFHISYVKGDSEQGKNRTTVMTDETPKNGTMKKRRVKKKSTINETSDRYLQKREQRTTKRLAFVVGFFIICWLPFFIVYVVTPFVEENQIPSHLYDFLTWLGWLNSTLNPILYAWYDQKFRSAFKHIVLRQKRTKPEFRKTTVVRKQTINGLGNKDPVPL